LNSHSHADHVGNNDLIHLAQAKETQHYLSQAGLSLLDAPSYFAGQFSTLSEYYDPATGFQAHRLRWRAIGVLRDIAKKFAGERRTLEMIFLLYLYLRKFEPLDPSLETIQTYESLPRQPLVIGNVPWTGWVLGEDDVWVLEERGHTPDEVLFYLPEHQLLHTADLTLPLFPTFPSSDGAVIRATLERCRAMASAGAIRVLTDGHHHMVYRGQEEADAFVGTMLFEHKHFQAVLRDILEAHDGLTVGELYAHLQRRHGDPVVQHYLSLEFPYLPMALQQIIAVSLPEMGYKAEGPRGNQRFYRPAITT
jgi:glyoxylase-like metal-dependent hydrolase (beta-lactamase superfamily II)